MGARVMYWFRTDLRLHDSPALQAALELEPAVLWPIFTWDPHFVRGRGGPNRWQYLLDCQKDVSASLSRLNRKSRLLVVREAPQTVLPKLFGAWAVTHLVFEKDTDPYARERDRVVARAARDAGVQVITRYGRTLWDSDTVVAENGGKPTMSIQQLQKAGAKIGPVPRPLPAPTWLPAPGEMPVEFEGGGDSGVAGPSGDFAVPTLAELGLGAATTPHRGGESLALDRLDRLMQEVDYMATFRKPERSPAALEASTTLLSPCLHFGALSPRLLYWRAQDAVTAYGEGASKPPESMTGQLLFRDMYFAAYASLGWSFAQTAHNRRARFVPWHLPSKLDAGGRSSGEYEVDSPQAETWFRRWEAGVTGFPWIDALMRQLRETGWIEHLGRHAVACFLTRGGCYVDWERGADVFADLLLDHEPASNAGNWQWLSCTAFFSQYHRCYSPVAFPRRWDASGEFVRRWVPELRQMDARYVYEPWKAPIADQDKAGVRIVGYEAYDAAEADYAHNAASRPTTALYPKPMFDFDSRRQICMAAMKKAFAVGLYGDDARVLNGTWRTLFPADSAAGDGQGHEQGKVEDAVVAVTGRKRLATLDGHFTRQKRERRA